MPLEIKTGDDFLLQKFLHLAVQAALEPFHAYSGSVRVVDAYDADFRDRTIVIEAEVLPDILFKHKINADQILNLESSGHPDPAAAYGDLVAAEAFQFFRHYRIEPGANITLGEE